MRCRSARFLINIFVFVTLVCLLSLINWFGRPLNEANKSHVLYAIDMLIRFVWSDSTSSSPLIEIQLKGEVLMTISSVVGIEPSRRIPLKCAFRLRVLPYRCWHLIWVAALRSLAILSLFELTANDAHRSHIYIFFLFFFFIRKDIRFNDFHLSSSQRMTVVEQNSVRRLTAQQIIRW